MPGIADKFRSLRICPGMTLKMGALGRNHEIDRLGAFALFVRFDLECDALSFGQVLQPGSLHGRDVDENIATAVVGLDKAVAAFSVEELDRSSHGHRETPPRIAPPIRSRVSADRTNRC